MTMSRPFLSSLAIALAAITLISAAPASADPPSRVARLGYATGAVSFSPAGESDWVEASINRPLTLGDRLWVDADARAEIQVGGAQVRLDGGSGVSIVQIDERITQIELTEGVMLVRVRRLDPGQVFEIDTPNLAFTVRKPGEFRIGVDRDGEATTIVVRRGEGEVVGGSASYFVDARQPYRFAGNDLRDIYDVDMPRLDAFDRWASERDRYYDRSVSARYVSDDVVGYQDLDTYGTWRSNPTYGNVWYPTRVDAGWAPYRDGHWAWVDPWGWTWVDDAPWGFAVTHYGRWANVNNQWGWIPGPVRSRAVYAPALVVFVGGDNFQLSIGGGNVGGIGWFPLGPREVFRPSYTVSRGYYENVNRSNTVINTTVINNTYNNTNVTNVVYANRQVPGAIVAVPTTTFVQSRPVRGNAVRVSREMVASAPLAAVAPVAPTPTSVRGAAGPGSKPPERTFSRQVVARTAPPPAPASFAAQQQQLNANRGKPLETAARRALPPAAAVTTPVVAVAPGTRDARPTARPPSRARDASSDTASTKPGERQASPPPKQAEREASSPSKPGERQTASPPRNGERQVSSPQKADERQASPPPKPGERQVASPPAVDRPAAPTAPRTASPAPASPQESNRQRDAADRRSPGAVVMPPPAARVPTAPAAAAPSNAPQRTAAPGSKPDTATAQRTPPNGKDDRDARSTAERATPPRAVPAQPLAPASTRSAPPGKSTARDAKDLADEAERQTKGRDNAKRAQDQNARDDADRGRDDKPR